MALDAVQIRQIVERHFRVYDVREQKHKGVVVARGYCLLYPKGEFDGRYQAAHDALVAAFPDTLVFTRHDGGEDVLYITERPQAPPTKRGLRLVMFIATLLTTIVAGTLFWVGYTSDGASYGYEVLGDPHAVWMGFATFALPLLLILGIHETAHFVAAKRHRLRATLPLFIPAPPLGPVTIGTFGAFISLRDPLPNRKAMFDVGASGPLAGFFVALPILILGCFLTAASGQAVPDLDRPSLLADGSHILSDQEPGKLVMTFDAPSPLLVLHLRAPANVTYNEGAWDYKVKGVVTLANGTTRTDQHAGKLKAGQPEDLTFAAGPDAKVVTLTVTWDDHLISFGDPLLVKILRNFFDLDSKLTHPTFFAGWVGLLITGINLLPTGQLDGGHVGRAVFGSYNRYVAYGAIGLLILLAIGFSSWTLMALFVLLTGVEHPPPLNDHTPLDTKRKLVAAFVLLVLVLTFVPIPFSI